MDSNEPPCELDLLLVGHCQGVLLFCVVGVFDKAVALAFAVSVADDVGGDDGAAKEVTEGVFEII